MNADSVAQSVTIARCDRWQLHQRLSELDISCTCTSEGGLQVDINYPIELVQLQSVIQQLTASRINLIVWLERCWAADFHH
jgi:hypothetical protein